MSCGLGAVILVFMLIKYHADDAPVATNFLRDEIRILQAEESSLIETLRELTIQATGKSENNAMMRDRITTLQSKLADTQAEIEKSRHDTEALKENIKKTTVKKADDIVKIDRESEETYLLGLQVKGKKIAILLDASASMTAEQLVDVIKIKNGGRQDKLTANKWLRTRRVVKWLLSRLPQKSEVMVMAFNHSVYFLGDGNWRPAGDQHTLQAIADDLEMLVPDGATNLHKGLLEVKKRQATDLYVITDGLPTDGESRYKSLNPFTSCSSLRGSANTISGACRVKLFKQTVAETALHNTVVNIVLLPIEGDPDAVNQYWEWASKTGGLVISPAANWP